MNKLLMIEIAYGGYETQAVISLKVKPGTKVREAIQQSAIETKFPEIDLNMFKIGIYGKPCNLEDVLEDNDRVEIYRPLKIDPKESRRAKAKLQKKKA